MNLKEFTTAGEESQKELNIMVVKQAGIRRAAPKGVKMFTGRQWGPLEGFNPKHEWHCQIRNTRVAVALKTRGGGETKVERASERVIQGGIIRSWTKAMAISMQKTRDTERDYRYGIEWIWMWDRRVP